MRLIWVLIRYVYMVMSEMYKMLVIIINIKIARSVYVTVHPSLHPSLSSHSLLLFIFICWLLFFLPIELHQEDLIFYNTSQLPLLPPQTQTFDRNL